MEITAAKVNELRQKTGAGMMDCKKALVEANGDFEKAIELLRKKGAAVASKRAEKSANEGIVLTKISDDKKFCMMVEVNCETDFVARSEDFVSFANFVLESAASRKAKNLDEFLKSNPTISEKLSDIMGKVGEKVEVSRVTTENTNNGLVVDYIHPGSKLGVLVMFDELENFLSEQSYIKDNTKSVSDLIKEFNTKFNTSVKLVRFKRFHLSDEKK